MFSIAGFDMEYEEWFEIMLDSFEEGKDYTLDRYAHVTASMQRESAARMQSFLDSL